MIEPKSTTTAELFDRYEGVLIDVYGVLLDAAGPLPGAFALMAELHRRAMPYAIVTNDASRSPATYSARFARHGIAISEERFITAGGLLPGYFRDRGLVGARTCVLGTADSVAFVRAGGGVPIKLTPGVDLDVLAICDDDGFDFLPTVEAAATALLRMVAAGRRPTVVLANPDLIYPKGEGEIGFTAGSIALLIAAAFARRFPSYGLVIDQLGKPQPFLFSAASRLLGIAPHRLVMIGDQIETDVAGAQAAGIDAALLTGISDWHHAQATTSVAPQWLIDTLSP